MPTGKSSPIRRSVGVRQANPTEPQMSHLDTLRAIYLLAANTPVTTPIDPDLAREAGMDGNLQRLLQAARQLDREQNTAPAQGD